MRIKLLVLLCGIIFLTSCKDDYKYGPGGVLENQNDTANCDTFGVTYTTHIAPLLKDNCTPCHFSPSASGGVSLDDYNSVSNAIKNQGLIKSVNYQSSASKNMPPSKMLNNCSLKKIDIWFKEGLQK